MRFELKKSQVKETNPIKFWYCEIPYTLYEFDRIWYTKGVYWRNEDIFNFDWYIISTWYRPTWERPENEEKRKELEEKIKKWKYTKQFIYQKILELAQEHYNILYSKKHK